jgi:hypothetical protein
MHDSDTELKCYLLHELPSLMTSGMASQASGSSVDSERVGVHVQLESGSEAKADVAGDSSSATLTDAQIRALVQELKPKVRFT